ncbi:MAG TPA: fructosamine kinase family protein [Usitatibacter sp.]|nr:fructosamine kinase family protein [Usitatibacter sp.]
MKPFEALTQKLAGAISDAMEALFEATSVEAVGGGCIHTAVRITGEMAGERHAYFAKVNEADRAPMFAAEADGLAALRDAQAIAVPNVVTNGDDGEHAWLILQWLELTPLDAQSAANLGVALAAQHRKTQDKFGWALDNFIGATPQANGRTEDWLAFWREKRLMAQLRLAARNRLPSRMIDRGERLAADCAAFFTTHRPEKSLLHGDLWIGNAATIEGVTPAIFDPAVYVGDREADIAMTELFGSFPHEFHAAYRATWALDDGYGTRRNFYNLYHVLNHANLFAGGYVRQAEQSVEKLLAEIG